jgi:hypothetical protein
MSGGGRCSRAGDALLATSRVIREAVDCVLYSFPKVEETHCADANISYDATRVGICISGERC